MACLYLTSHTTHNGLLVSFKYLSQHEVTAVPRQVNILQPAMIVLHKPKEDTNDLSWCSLVLL